jgi:hypothetical protein
LLRAAGSALAVVVSCRSPPARAFPGVLVAKDDGERGLRSTSIALMRHRGLSIVTLSAEYEGPLTPFAFVVPVPSDVRASAVKTVRRGLLSRVEALSAPRFHAFYEQDPCDEAPPDQGFDEHLKAKGAGFLALPGLPPLDRHYAVSNEISVPVTATFKERESEFHYRDLVYAGTEKLKAQLIAAGYRVGDAALELLGHELRAGQRLLLVEVSLSHVELAADNRVQLGGIRYVSREPVTKFDEALGRTKAPGEDVFVYVFDRTSRYELANHENARVPLAVRVEPRAAEHLATVYDALFDAFAARHPDAYVTEFAWPTSGCGEPCPDVPLGPDELLTLGGDVLEAETTTPSERAPEPSEEPPLERERFEAHLAELGASERPAAVREHAAERREIERRRALVARQTYVLSRLHHRYVAGAERRDLELAPARPLAGGTGIPRGARGEVALVASEAPENRLEVRFFALKPWTLGSACSSPARFRWGKRWASEARAPRAVPLALDLASQSRDPRVLRETLLVSLPELGLTAAEPSEPSVSAPARATEPAPSASPAKARGCSNSAAPPRPADSTWLAVGFFSCLVVCALRVRRRVARVSEAPRASGARDRARVRG